MIKVNRHSAHPFSGFNSTSANNTNKKWEWVESDGDIDMFVDDHILFNSGGYAWLIEPRSVIPHVYNQIDSDPAGWAGRFEKIFTYDKSLTRHSGFYFVRPSACPWVTDRRITKKAKRLSMISSNKQVSPQHIRRFDIANSLRWKLDLYGLGFNWIENKEEGLQDYLFSVAIENDNYDCLFSEKLTDCFATGTIPIWDGTTGVDRYFDMDGIILYHDDIDLSQFGRDFYMDRQKHIKNNYEAVLDMPTTEDLIAEEHFNQ